MHAALIIARYAWLRLWRGKRYWITLLLAAAPVVLAILPGAVAGTSHERWRAALELAIQLVPLSAAIHLAGAVAEELENATVTYLWTRPIPRASLLLGKLLAALPVVLLVAVVPVLAIHAITRAGSAAELAAALTATTLGALTASMVAAGIGALVPRHAFLVALSYLLFLDKILGAVPNLGYASIVYYMRALAGLHADIAAAPAAMALGILALLWLGIGLWRLGTIEPTTGGA